MDKNDFLVQLGKRVIFLRKQKELTQSELARRCDKEKQSIERLERGKINPSVYYLMEIAEGMGIKVKDLLDF